MNPFSQRFLNRNASQAGFTLAESLVALGVAMVGMAGVMLLNSAHLRFVKSARQSNAATLALQERVEQMRLANWRKMTSSAYLKDTLLAATPKSVAPLDQLSERITITAYPDPTVCQKLVVERLPNANPVILVSGDGLATQRLAKVELEVNWSGSDKRSRTRATNTIISNGGVSRMNLPGFGASGGGSVSTDPGSGTTTPTTPGTGSDTTPGTTLGGGNGGGRGNVGGKSGKK